MPLTEAKKSDKWRQPRKAYFVKKKILIVNNNMNIGGVQKALIPLLNAIKGYYDVTLFLFYAHGELLREIPPEVKIIEAKGIFKYLGMSQKECTSYKDKLTRGCLAAIAKTAGFKWSWRLMQLVGKPESLSGYDVAISYLHCAEPKIFYGGAAEYVLYDVHSQKKLCYVHCDYINSGTLNQYSKSVYQKFDAIVGVSDSVARQFTTALPQMKDKTFAIRNFVDAHTIIAKAEKEPHRYDRKYINCLSVARLSAEKGVDRFINVLGKINSEKIRYYVVGDGKERALLEKVIRDKGLENRVFLLGEKNNPYRYMHDADLLVVPSYHEAAPVVFQEAHILGLPVLTTDTLSAKEMVSAECGFVVENSERGMETAMNMILSDPNILTQLKNHLHQNVYDETEVLNSILKLF